MPSRSRQREALAQLQRDRKARAQVVAQLDARYRDRAQREQALGRDAKALERLLAQLRAAAAREAAAQGRRRARRARGALRRARRTRPRRARDRQCDSRCRSAASAGRCRAACSRASAARCPTAARSSGVLIAAPAGTPVRAVADGRVVFSDWMNGYGLILIVDHGNGTMSLYAHNEALLRDTGDSVQRGDPVASVGNSGAPGRPALYFELRRNGQSGRSGRLAAEALTPATACRVRAANGADPHNRRAAVDIAAPVCARSPACAFVPGSRCCSACSCCLRWRRTRRTDAAARRRDAAGRGRAQRRSGRGRNRGDESAAGRDPPLRRRVRRGARRPTSIRSTTAS